MGESGKGGKPIAIIKSSVRLSEYVARFTQLKSSGEGSYRGCCPIHGGDNPTGFGVIDTPDGGYWKCFSGSCGGGSILDFWMGINDSDELSDAIDGLAKELNVTLPDTPRGSWRVSLKRAKGALGRVADAATDHLFDSDDGEDVMDYLEERRIRGKSIEDWSLGLLPEGSAAVDLIKQAAGDEIRSLIAVGLLKESPSGDLWAPLHGRLIFPIRNQHDDVVGFSGRQVEGREYSSKGKYINSPTSDLFDKSSMMYGMEHLENADKVYICEGQFDVIALNRVLPQDSVAVALLGTSLTKRHVEALKSKDRVYLVLDGDRAGEKAALACLWATNHLHDALRVILLPEGSDPSEIFREGGKKALREAISSSAPILKKCVQMKWNSVGGDEAEMEKWVKSLVPSLMYTESRDNILNDVALMMGKNPTSFKRSLSLPSPRRGGSGASQVEHLVGENVRSFCGALMKMEQPERDGILAGMRPWNAATETAISTIFSTSGELDLQIFRRLALGVDDSDNTREVDVAMSMFLDPDIDPHIGRFISSMAKNILHVISTSGIDMDGETDLFQSARSVVRKIAGNNLDVSTQAALFSYLLDMTIYLERVQSRKQSAPSTGVGAG